MEVHHHAHLASGETHRSDPGFRRGRKWMHYFWEFLMLFLAVFCGFLAENEREHYIEHKREKKYVMQLLQDLKIDTASYRRMSQRMHKQARLFDSASRIFVLKTNLSDAQFVKLAKRLWAAYNPITISTTFNQMKSSGSLRYIRNDSLSESLSVYYDLRIPRLHTFFDYVNEKLHTQIEPFFARHFNLYANQFLGGEDLVNIEEYYDRTAKTDQQIKNYFKLYYIGINYIHDTELKGATDNAIDIINRIRKEYHLK